MAAHLIHKFPAKSTNSHHDVARCIFFAFILLTICASLLISLWPAHPAIPLVAKSEWIIQGHAFQNTEPRAYEVRDSIQRSPQVTYWRTWSPGTQATKADIRTAPFRPAPYMAIPYGGFANARGNSVDIICLATNKHFPVATARTNTQMTEAFIRLPSSSCNGSVSLHAHSDGDNYLVVGTPFSINWIDYYKNSFAGLLAIFVALFAFTLCLVLVPGILAHTYHKPYDPITLGITALGVFGYAMFFIFFASAGVGRVISSIILFSAAIVLTHSYRKNYVSFKYIWGTWRTPTLLWIIVTFAAFCLSVSVNNGAGPWTVNALFEPVHWSSDNQLPMQISEYIFRGIDPRTLDLGPWKVSDRPPLAYGLMASLRMVSSFLTSHSDGNDLYYQYQQIAGIILNGLWIVALYHLLTQFLANKKKALQIILLTTLTPFVIFNSVYVWPKMLGAAFALLAFLILFDNFRPETPKGESKFGPSLQLAALLSGLALMCHGGTAFGLMAAILVAFWYRRPSIGLAIRAGLLGISVLIPWALWQHFEQPPGNALVKYALSGNFGFGEDGKSVLATVHDAYSKLTLSSWIQMKYDALRILVTGHGSTCGVQETGPINSFFSLLRSQDFFYLGPSLRFLALGFFPLFLFTRAKTDDDESIQFLRISRVLVGVGLLSVGLYTLAGFDCYINHMQSYQAMLQILTGLIIAMISAKKWYLDLALKLSIGYAIVVWIIDPLSVAQGIRIIPLLALGALGAFVYKKMGATRAKA